MESSLLSPPEVSTPSPISQSNLPSPIEHGLSPFPCSIESDIEDDGYVGDVDDRSLACPFYLLGRVNRMSIMNNTKVAHLAWFAV